MVYIDLRYTPQETDNYEVIYKYIIKILDDAQKERDSATRDSVKYIVVREQFNKFGEKTHLHYHMNFHIPHHSGNDDIKKDNLQKQLNRNLKLKGNKMYCLRVHHDIPTDVDRWWNYTCKQGINGLVVSAGFSQIDLETMVMIASAEYEQRKKENCETRQKLMDKNNFRNKLIIHMKKIKSQDRPRLTDKQIWLEVAGFYRKSHMTPPYNKLDDIVVDVKVELEYLSLDEYYDKTH